MRARVREAGELDPVPVGVQLRIDVDQAQELRGGTQHVLVYGQADIDLAGGLHSSVLRRLVQPLGGEVLDACFGEVEVECAACGAGSAAEVVSGDQQGRAVPTLQLERSSGKRHALRACEAVAVRIERRPVAMRLSTVRLAAQ